MRGSEDAIRIGHVISGDLWAGAETMCLRLLTGLSRMQDVELFAIVLNEGKLAREIRKLGIPVAMVDESTTGFPRAVRRIREIVAQQRPDILHTHRLKENILGYLARRGAGRPVPLVCTQHGLDEPQSRLKWRALSWVNRRILARRFRWVVAVSEEMRAVLTGANGIPGRKLTVIHNGTEVRDVDSRDAPDRPFTIGSAGRLFPVKNYPFLVELAAEIHRHAPEVRFELAGEGPEAEGLRESIRARGLQSVFALRGFIEDMPAFYERLDLYVNTSLHEGFPMTVLEAMSCGLPVVAPVSGGIREAVSDGVNGFLVNGKDPKAFAQRCLKIYTDAGLRAAMGVAARERVARDFSVRSMAESYRALYRDAVS